MKRLVTGLVMLPLLWGAIEAQLSLNASSQRQMVMTNLLSMPISFTENHGQWGDKTLFKAEAGGATFYFCKDEVAYIFTRDTDELEESPLPKRAVMPGMPDKSDKPRYKKEIMLIRAEFIGANPNPEIVGEDRLSHNCNYFYGNDPTKWRTDVPNYSAITYKDIWPGIDLRYHGNGQGMKYDFIVNPGADICQIRVRYDGVNNLAVTSNGDLQADTRFGIIFENIPAIYQEHGSRKTELAGRYAIVEPGVFGFEAENYNPNLPLVIDPELVYSTYLGGDSHDWGWDIAIDDSSNAYVVGFTLSTDFPTQNPYQIYQGYETYCDAFVTKLSPSGNSLVYSTYLGGNDGENGYGIAVDSSGYTYVTGGTFSTDFPTQDPYQADQPGWDAFVTKLSPSGESLVYSTYLGGNENDYTHDIAVDRSGNAYVMGHTHSTDFPLHNPHQTDQPETDAFVTKFGPQTGIDDDGRLPSVFSLSQNFPNPFNSQTSISFSLQQTGRISLVIYDILGRKAACLIDGIQDAGPHILTWDASNTPSGLYFARLHAGKTDETIKMILLK